MRNGLFAIILFALLQWYNLTSGGQAKILAKTDPENMKCNDIVSHAITAHGGVDKLKGSLVYSCSLKGTRWAGEQKGAMEVDAWFQHPNQSKISFRIDYGSVELQSVRVLNGNKAWERSNNVTSEVDKDTRALMEFSAYTVYLSRLYPLLDEKTYTMSYCGEVKLDGRPTEKIKIASAKRENVWFYFDKETWLLTKMDIYTFADNKKSLSEEFYSEYKEVSGTMVAFKKVVLLDGRKYLDAVYTDMKFHKSLDSSVFAKPE